MIQLDEHWSKFPLPFCYLHFFLFRQENFEVTISDGWRCSSWWVPSVCNHLALVHLFTTHRPSSLSDLFHRFTSWASASFRAKLGQPFWQLSVQLLWKRGSQPRAHFLSSSLASRELEMCSASSHLRRSWARCHCVCHLPVRSRWMPSIIEALISELLCPHLLTRMKVVGNMNTLWTSKAGQGELFTLKC